MMDPLEDLINNFDVKEFLPPLPGSINSSLSPGMKVHSDDTMTSFDDESFIQTELISDAQFPNPIPSTTEMHGNYNFHVELGQQSKRVANPEWVYKNSKLYIKPGTLCPIIFSASSSVPEPCCVRIMPVFKNAEDSRDVVRCCPNHVMENVEKANYSTVKHFVRCENDQVLYKECPITGRNYLVLPFTPRERDNQTKTLSTHELLSFVCNNSCVGLNRRPIQIIFEISHRQAILGRGLLEVRVCACPGRDSNIDERHQRQPLKKKRRLDDEITGLNRSQNNDHNSMWKSPTNTFQESKGTLWKKKKATTEHFYLKVNGRQNFIILERISKALELFTTMEKRFFSKNLPPHKMQRSRSQFKSGEDPEPGPSIYSRQVAEAAEYSPNEPAVSGFCNSWLDPSHTLREDVQ